MTVFNDSIKNIIAFCAGECEKQKVGPRAVMWMAEAWDFALDKVSPWRLSEIKDLGLLVEPIQNASGFRQVPVILGNTVLDNHQHIPRLIENLINVGTGLTPEEWYYEFELIHPFIDGNGRVGQILFNWMCGTLHRPVSAPDHFKEQDSRLSDDK